MNTYPLLTALLFPAIVIAQDTLPATQKHLPEHRFTIAVEGGPSVTWISKGYPKMGFLAGAAAHYHAFSFFSAGVGLYYERKGTNTVPDAVYDEHMKTLEYFTIHPMASFYAGGKVRFAGRVGGFLAIPLSYTRGIDLSIVPFADVGITVSAGLDVRVHRMLRLRLENRAAFGFGKLEAVSHISGSDFVMPIRGSFSNSIVLGLDILLPGNM